ncbi:MAG: hypothetical protein AUJ47_12725 [Candidatus Marinimicrobia bacterium CG1_02_48_14]|nr:MAG: hypothetical protein AUJ47_12725 [Candidatus Marinimicrobia bacterium CG1_02_48_14]
MRNILKITTLAMSLSVFFACVSFGGCIDGSGQVKSETREVASFSGINISGSADVFLTPGETQSLTIQTDDNLLELITTDVKGQNLYIGNKKCFKTRNDVKIFITVPTLSDVTISGSSDVKGADLFKCGDLGLKISGSGNITLAVDADDVDMSISGSGDMEIKGSAEDLTIRISGSGGLNSRDLETKSVTAIISGSGDCMVNTTGDLNAVISGSGDVTYFGNPKSVDTSISGSGSVKKGTSF